VGIAGAVSYAVECYEPPWAAGAEGRVVQLIRGRRGQEREEFMIRTSVPDQIYRIEMVGKDLVKRR